MGSVRTSPPGRPCGLHQAGEEDVEGADATVADGGLHALHPDAHIGGRAASPSLRPGGAPTVRGGYQGGGAGRVRVLLGVRAGAVAVLEVDAQILDGLTDQLGADPVMNIGGERVGDAEDGGERTGVGGVRVEGGERLVTPGTHGVGGECVAGDIDRVDRLAGAGVARVAPRQIRVHLGESGADALAYGVREACRHGLLLPHSLPLPVLTPDHRAYSA